MKQLIIYYFEDEPPTLTIEEPINGWGGQVLKVLNSYSGKEAKDLYEKLINHTNKEEK